MDVKTAKASDNIGRVVLGLKRKQSLQHATCVVGSPGTVSPQFSTMNSSMQLLGKRRKLDECKTKVASSGCHHHNSLLRCYSNFMKSGVPQRLMYYENGEWTDFPQHLIALIRNDLQEKKAAVEVDLDGRQFLLDFLHMLLVDLETGSRQPIAWIDEADNCFFPEFYADGDGSCEYSENEYGKDQPYGPHEIKLQLEIDISGVNQSKLKECSGESNALVKHIQLSPNSSNNQFVLEVEDSCNQKADMKEMEADEEKKHSRTSLVSRANFADWGTDPDAVREVFLFGMGPNGGVDIHDIHRTSSDSLLSRFELFQKQLEITKRCRGNANVRFAWLATSKGALPTIMKYGLGHCGKTTTRSKYGFGVHLSAASSPGTRSRFFFFFLKFYKHFKTSNSAHTNNKCLCIGDILSFKN